MAKSPISFVATIGLLRSWACFFDGKFFFQSQRSRKRKTLQKIKYASVPPTPKINTHRYLLNQSSLISSTFLFCLRNSLWTKRTFIFVSWQSCVRWLHVYFASMRFGKRKWKFEFEKGCCVRWWPTVRKPKGKLSSQWSYLLLVSPFVREATARILLLDFVIHILLFMTISHCERIWVKRHLRLVSGEKYAIHWPKN